MNPPTDFLARLLGLHRNWRAPETPLLALARVKRDAEEGAR